MNTGFKKISFLSFLYLCHLPVKAQQMWGITSSNYAGVSGIDLNPSSMVTSKVGWDFNIVSLDASLSNNSFYTAPQFVFPLLFKTQVTFATSSTEKNPKNQNADLVIRDNIQNSTYVSVNARIQGPSYMYTNGTSAYAFTTAFRTGASLFGLPATTAKIAYENLNYAPLQNQVLRIENGVSGGTMSWTELGGSYARKLVDSRQWMVTGGTSVKILIGSSGAYGVSRGTDFMVPYRANFTAIDLNFDYAHAIDLKNPVSLTPTGIGLSGDIGFTFIRKKKGRSNYYSCPVMIRKSVMVTKNYKWKLGISLIDLGGINFTQKAAAYSYSNVSYSWDTITKVKFKTIEQVDQTIYNNFSPYGNSTYKNSFFMWAPTAMSAQVDYNFNDQLYLNASIVQRMVINTQARLARMNSFAITPRYETADFEISMPFIVNEYLYPNIGAMVRYKSFFIGSDQLGATFGITPLYGLDLYLGIKISHFGMHKEPKFRY